MAVIVTHTKVSTIPDDADTSLIRPSDWNDTHTLTGVGTMATQDANAVAITGGTISGVSGLVTSVTGTSPVVSSGGTTPAISMPAATTSVNGYLTSTDWTTFNNKGSGSVTSVAATAGTGISVTGSPITTSGTLNITNTAPDQTVALTAGTGISTTGTYPNFTITNTSPSLGGDVVGPASATDNAIARFDATTGKLIQDSVVTIGDTGATTGVTTFSASTSVTTPIVQASNSGGLALKNSGGTTQMSVGAGGGDNMSINVSTNLNGTNAQIDISPTGTGHVHIKPSGTGAVEIAPTNAGTMNNMVIGGTTAAAGSFTDLSVTGTTSFDGSQGTVGQVLTSAGTGATPTWTTPTTGTVTSVAATVPSFLSVSGSPITTSGTLALTYSGTALPIANGGTGATTLAGANIALTNASNSFSANQIVSVTGNTNAALHITQLGTGNALLVEDSANPDSSPFVVTADGTVIRGYTSPVVTDNYVGTQGTPLIQTHANATTASGLASFVWESTGVSPAPSVILSRSRSATIGSFSSVASGDAIGAINFNGDDGTAFVVGASITSYVDGTPGTNDMPGRLVFSTTADGASTVTERMRIDSTGAVGIGTTSLGAGYGLRVTKTFGADNGSNIFSTATGSSSTPTATFSFRSSVATASNSGTPYTISNIYSNYATQGTFNADSTVTNQYGFLVSTALTGATNNYGFYSQIAAGTNRWNLYMAGTANNYLAGSLGIGTTSLTDRNLAIGKTITGATTAYGVIQNGTVQSDVTVSGVYNTTSVATAANGGTPYTISNIIHYNAVQGTFNADSTVTVQAGYVAASSMTGAGTNLGFRGQLAAATGRWNLYMDGTAANYFGGDMQFNKTVTAGGTTGAQTISKNAGTVNFAAAATSLVVTNTLVTTSSIIICTVGTNDTTMKSALAVAAAGSFTIYSNAAATAETRVNFIVIN